jgi:hypothetical protein
VISVDTKKKELVGDFKNGGREWQPTGQPELVQVRDFVDRELGRAIPYGVYDLATNQGWVSVGTDHDTPTFAVQAIRSWWQQIGRPTYPAATDLLITADGGGSNSCRARRWNIELQRLTDETGSLSSLVRVRNTCGKPSKKEPPPKQGFDARGFQFGSWRDHSGVWLKGLKPVVIPQVALQTPALPLGYVAMTPR